MIKNCKLLDLGFSGPKFTWRNMRKGIANVQEWIDQALFNQEWFLLFPNCQVLHLPPSRSDHPPLCLRDRNQPRILKVNTSFRIQAAWFTRPQFEGMLERSWFEDDHIDLAPRMQSLLTKLQH